MPADLQREEKDTMSGINSLEIFLSVLFTLQSLDCLKEQECEKGTFG